MRRRGSARRGALWVIGLLTVVAAATSCGSTSDTGDDAAPGAGTTSSAPSTEGEQPASATGDDPVNQLAVAIVACLGDRGWDAKASWDGGVEMVGTVPAEQLNAYQADYTACLEASQNLLPTEDVSWKTERYDKQVAERQCLVDLGYSIDVAPSLQTYLDTYGTADEWFPMQQVNAGSLDAAQREQVFKQCPPPEWYS